MLLRHLATATAISLVVTLPAAAGATTVDASAAVASSAASPLLGQTRLASTGQRPFDMAVSRNGKRGVVVGGQRIEKLSLGSTTAKVTGRTTRARGQRVALHPRGTFAYVVDDKQVLRVVDIRKTPKVVTTLRRKKMAPSNVFDVEISPNGKYLYLLHGYAFGGWGRGAGIQVLSLKNPKAPRKVKRVTFPSQSDGRLAVGAKGKRVFATDHRRDVVRAINVSKPTRPTLLKTRRVPYDVVGVASAYNGRFLYASGWKSGRVAISKISRSSMKIQRTTYYAVANTPSDIAVSPDGRRVHMTINGAPSQPTYLRVSGATLAEQGAVTGLRSPQLVVSPPRTVSRPRVWLADYPGRAGGAPTLLTLSN